jgi:hypothetical protein
LKVNSGATGYEFGSIGVSSTTFSSVALDAVNTVTATAIISVEEKFTESTSMLANETSIDTAGYGDTTQTYYGQQFDTTGIGAFSLGRVKVRVGSLNGSGINRTVTCAIYADDGGSGTAARPTGSALGSATLSGFTSTGDQLFTFSTAVALSNNTKYWFVLSCTGDNSNTVEMTRNSVYSSGFTFKSTSLSGGNAYANDLYFNIYALVSYLSPVPITSKNDATGYEVYSSTLTTGSKIWSIKKKTTDTHDIIVNYI